MKRIVWCVCWVVMVCGGCSVDEVVEWGKSRFVERHQGQARGKVGVLRALEISDSAARVARAVERRGDAVCGPWVRGPFETTLTVLIEVVRAESRGVVARVEESRTVSVDARGSVRVVSSVSFQDKATKRGVNTREERWIDHSMYTREHNAPFVVRRVHEGSRAELLRRSLDAVPSVLAAGKDTWVRDVTAPEGTFIGGPDAPEGSRRSINCGLLKQDRAWLLRVLMRGDVEFAQAFLGRDDRGVGARNASLRVMSREDDRRFILRVDVDELTNTADVPTIEAPSDVADIHRDRPFEDMRKILERRLKIQDWGKLPPLEDSEDDLAQEPSDEDKNAPSGTVESNSAP